MKKSKFKQENNKTFAFVVNDDKYFLSHRLPIGLELLKFGYTVHIILGKCTNKEELEKLGFIPHVVKFSRKGKNPFKEFFIFLRILKILKKIRPEIVHLVNIKPYLYGAIAARIAKVPGVVSAVAGLGDLFSSHRKKTKFLRFILKPIYKIAFNHPNQKVIFQNNDDKIQLQNWINLENHKSTLIKGSGVDLKHYPYTPEPLNNPPIISLASRLLKNKGILELIEAAKMLKKKGIKVNIQVIGEPDLENTNTLTYNDLKKWHNEGLINYLGYRTDIAALFSSSNIITLPSYYGEGLPKVLIEAAACGRAIITTDHPGCRDAILEGKTGVLIPIKDSEALQKAIQKLIQNPQLRVQMGIEGRKLAEQEFSIEKVIKKHFSVYKEILEK